VTQQLKVRLDELAALEGAEGGLWTGLVKPLRAALGI